MTLPAAKRKIRNRWCPISSKKIRKKVFGIWPLPVTGSR
ncbi:hypothetical protein Cabys_2639 [Caldithrix abyssi DSM 13497]|uniref:Uncharacterized protein n=1 Tax=Caldithrix abyssi DSM 13497 TaxID=880073 RepID=A0A1J1CAF5_CALAY|nr:hypothetical protein Cabys_2639 [Caldithrix abyssi DSM 13497]